METKTKSQLSKKAAKLMENCGLETVFATPKGDFFSEAKTAKVVYGPEIEIFTFTKVKK